MMSRILFISLAVAALITGQNLLVAQGASISDPVIACVFTLIVSPWLSRQFD